MVTPFNPALLQAQSPYQPAPAPQAALPKTSGALVINVLNPTNYSGDTYTPNASSGAAAASAPGAPASAFTSPSPAAAPALPPNADPQQQLQSAYVEAEQARNKYLDLANKLNGEAFQNKFSAANNPNGFFLPPESSAVNSAAQSPFSPFALPSAPNTPLTDPAAQAQQQYPAQAQADPLAQQRQLEQAEQEQLAQQQQLAAQQQSEQQQAAQQQQLMAQQQQAQQDALLQQQQAAQQQQYEQQMAAAQQQQYEQQLAAAQQQAQQQQAQQAASLTPQQPAPGQPPASLNAASFEELNQMIAQPRTPDEQKAAMIEVFNRGQGNAATYETLKNIAMSDANSMPPGPEQSAALGAVQNAIYTLGRLDSVRNSTAPADQLNIVTMARDHFARGSKDPNANNPDVDKAYLQGLEFLNRSQEKPVADILKRAAKSKNPDVSGQAQRMQQNAAMMAQAGTLPPMPGDGASLPADALSGAAQAPAGLTPMGGDGASMTDPNAAGGAPGMDALAGLQGGAPNLPAAPTA